MKINECVREAREAQRSITAICEHNKGSKTLSEDEFYQHIEVLDNALRNYSQVADSLSSISSTIFHLEKEKSQ